MTMILRRILAKGGYTMKYLSVLEMCCNGCICRADTFIDDYSGNEAIHLAKVTGAKR